MYNLEKAKQPKLYEFHWEVQGYDCYLYKVYSPVFRVNFEVTEWQMELDLSKLQDVKSSSVPFSLKRISDIGPTTVTFEVDVLVKINDDIGYLSLGKRSKTFKPEDRLDLVMKIPPQTSEWLSSKSLFIHLKMESPQTDADFPQGYWYNKESLKAVEKDLETLYSEGHFHDLVFDVAGKTFKLHKCVLNTRWPKLMTTLKISENSPAVETKELSGSSPAILEKLFQFAYCGNVEFMYHLDNIEGGMQVFDLVKKHNFYRLNNSITQLSSECDSTQMFQSYRTSVEMKLADVLARDKAIGDFRTCDIPLKPRRLPTSEKPMTEEALEKFQRHIRFMDIRLYVDKGPLGLNWLMYSIILGKIPEKKPVTIMSKLYVKVGETEPQDKLLHQEIHIFRKEGNNRFKVHTFSTPFSEGKKSKRYEVTSEPIIAWDDLTDEKKGLAVPSRYPTRLNEKDVSSKDGSSKDIQKELDCLFRFELKLADGEYIHDERHGECIFEYKWDHKLFEDLKFMYDDKEKKFADVVVTSSGRRNEAHQEHVHKAILAARSQVLKAALEKKPKLEPLKIDIQPDCLKMFIHYIYTGLIPKVPSDKMDHLFSVADKYEMSCLRNVLENQGANGTATSGEDSSK